MYSSGVGTCVGNVCLNATINVRNARQTPGLVRGMWVSPHTCPGGSRMSVVANMLVVRVCAWRAASGVENVLKQ